jgi:hypothetical protein
MRAVLRLTILIACFARPAAAQSGVEISAGYSIAYDPRDAITLPAGWIASIAKPLRPAIAAVAEVSGQHATIPLISSNAELSVHTVMGGARASARVGPFIEFAQGVIGIARISGSAFGSTNSSTGLAFQPGAGVEWPFSRAWSARTQFDVRLVRGTADASSGAAQLRVAAALVYHRD